MGTRIVIIGGVAGGASAATKARRTNESAEVIILERGPYVSFANCGLPYYVGGEIPRVSDLLVMTPQRFADRYRIDVRLHHEATAIDTERKRVRVLDHTTSQEDWLPYDRLIVATGGRPVMPPIPGIDAPGVFPLTTVPEAQATREWIRQRGARTAVVVGAGYIGLEAVEAMLNIGLRVELVEKLDQVLPLLDPEMVSPVAAHLASKGVRLNLGAEVTRFVLDDGVLRGVELASGRVIPADVAIVAIGVRPELKLVQDANLKFGPTGGVAVDDRMRTSVPDVYACGDIVESKSRITGKPTRVPLAGPANKQGRVAGANAAGGNLTFPGVVGTSIVRVFDLTVAKTGLGEREARQAGYEVLVSYTHSADHATYYPGARRMSIKVVSDRDGRLLGAQVVGQTGVDKRIDVFATALFAGLDVDELEGLDLAYAPPYSSAKDPVNIAGFVAANVLRGEVKSITPAELARRIENGAAQTLLDVRDPGEFAAGHIPGATLIPLDTLRDSLDRVPKGKPVVAYCGVGLRSYHACRILMHHGYEVENLSGGYTSWAMAVQARAKAD